MTNLDIFSREWNQEATEMEAELGGIRIGPLKPLGALTAKGESEDEETLCREEEALRQKLTNQLKRMKERENAGLDYLRQHGVPLQIGDTDNSGMSYAPH